MSRAITIFIFAVCFFAGNLGAAILTGEFVPREPGTAIDLSTAGALDWVHGGYDSTNSNRKAGVSPTLGELFLIGEYVPQQVTNSVEFSWTDGTPFPTATNVLTSIGSSGETNGFFITIPSDAQVYKLRIYVGVFAAQGQLEVSLNDGVTPAYIDASLDSVGETNGVYLVDFLSDQTPHVLTVKFNAALLHETNGYVTLQAVALTTNAFPMVSVTGPVEEQNVLVGSETVISALPFDSDGTITNVEFFVKGAKIGEATNAPFATSWTNSIVGPHTVIAIATDNYGAQGTSAPVIVFVTGTNGALLSDISVAAANVDLTSEGVSDWVHWGLYTASSVDRKTGVPPQIGDLTQVGSEPAYNYNDNQTAFSWSDGAPNLNVIGTPTGVYVVGLSNGFELVLPADANPRTLKLYVGSFGARGKLTAALSDYSAPVFIDRSVDNPGNGPATVYTFNYASTGNEQTMTITFTCDQMYDGYGNVTFQAATLVSAVNPLYLTLAWPTNNAVFQAPATIELEASLTGGDGLPRTIEFYNGETKLGEDGTAPYALDWPNVLHGEYTITARTTNSLGSVQSSDPVRIFVVGGGGVMEGRFSTSSGSVSLTDDGTKDWVHWGLVKRSSLNRKANVLQQISDFTELGTGKVDRFDDNIVEFGWSDGTPTTSVYGSRTGLYVDEPGSGFQITVPADQMLRRLKVYAGLFAARGQFEATLSDFSVAPFIHSTFQSTYNNATAVYTIDYAAATPGQTLTIRYTSSVLFDEDWGNVTLQAAALRYLSPLAIPVNDGSDNVTFTFSTEPNWIYTVDHTESLWPANWVPIAVYPGTGETVTFAELPSGSTGFYRVRMTK